MGPNELTNFDETFHKSSTMNLLNTFFSDFENSNSMTSWRPLLLFSVAALSRSQFCFDFPKILGRVSKSQPTVCYFKSAKSVGNFGSYGSPRLRRNDKIAAKKANFLISCEFG